MNTTRPALIGGVLALNQYQKCGLKSALRLFGAEK
jgi:hypothetical protein